LHDTWDDGAGAVYELTERAGAWTTERTFTLPGAPLAFTSSPKVGITIVTLHDVLRFHEGALSAIHSGEFLYPNSVAVLSDGTVIIGMECAVVWLLQREYGFQERWLVPQRNVQAACACAVARAAGQPNFGLQQTKARRCS
jgi:hypothetical protein